MKYGYFDDKKREYVITRPDVPVSWTNYLGLKDFCTVISHNAGGYSFYSTPQYHRITRFRPNGVPLDRPGHYIYIRDDDTGEYWSVSWQPTGLSLDKASYTCRHGLSYSVFECEVNGIEASQTLFIPLSDPLEIWDLVLKNKSDRERRLSVYSYCEFSFHHIDMDNQNFQMSLYASGADYRDGIIDYDLYYEEFGYQYFTSSFEPDGFDCRRDEFLGAYRTETNPLAVETGTMKGSKGTTGNFCGALQKKLVLKPGEECRLFFFLGEGNHDDGVAMRKKYTDVAVDAAKKELAGYWDGRLGALQVNTPHTEMNSLTNIWTLYQAEVNVLFSRFASFVEVGGRTGLGYRDTAQDAMCIPHAEPEGCKNRLVQLLHGQVSAGYGLHLFQPEWFQPDEQKKAFKSPTVVPTPDKNSMIHGIEDTCSDDALWLIPAICEYVIETGEVDFFDTVIPYADKGEGTVYEHMRRSLEFSAEQIGPNGVCKGLRADWNDCLNLGGGESAMVSFLHYWALEAFKTAALFLGKKEDAEWADGLMKKVSQVCEDKLWDGKWYLRGYTGDGRKIGSQEAAEGKVHMECNTWAVISGVAEKERARAAMDAVDEYLYTEYGLMLNAPSFVTIDDSIGFVTRVYPGVKENGAIFSHPNPWAWVAECKLGRGDKAMKFYDSINPALQNDKIEIRKSEPYMYCQFVMGKDHALFGQANHPWMTGTAGWAYFAATRFMLGIRPGFDGLTIDPCIPAKWDGFTATRRWRGAEYAIEVRNPDHVEYGVKKVLLNGEEISGPIPMQESGTHKVEIIMG